MVTTEIRELSVEEMEAVAGGGYIEQKYVGSNVWQDWIYQNFQVALIDGPSGMYHDLI
jgi:hypothetical protein